MITNSAAIIDEGGRDEEPKEGSPGGVEEDSEDAGGDNDNYNDNGDKNADQQQPQEEENK